MPWVNPWAEVVAMCAWCPMWLPCDPGTESDAHLANCCAECCAGVHSPGLLTEALRKVPEAWLALKGSRWVAAAAGSMPLPCWPCTPWWVVQLLCEWAGQLLDQAVQQLLERAVQLLLEQLVQLLELGSDAAELRKAALLGCVVSCGGEEVAMRLAGVDMVASSASLASVSASSLLPSGPSVPASSLLPSGASDDDSA